MHIPSLQTLRAFEAAGRHRSYSKAADELGLTHGAISRRIRDLELRTGTRLFLRSGNHMIPTDEGRRLLSQVRNALSMLEGIFEQARRGAAPARLTISVSPALGSRWLTPRMADFRERHPGIQLSLSVSSDPVELGNGIDGAVRYGIGPWPGTRSSLLSNEVLFPVCSPAYRDRHRLKRPDQLMRATLLRHPWHSWAEWFRAAGLSAAEPQGSPEYSDSSLLMEAAAAGEGVALARGLLARDALRSGILVRLCDVSIADRNSYFLVVTDRPRQSGLDELEAWLRDAMSGDEA